MLIKTNGINIDYRVEGVGIPVIFIHAFPLNQTMWDDQLVALQNHCRVITLDLRGFERSEAPQGQYLIAGLPGMTDKSCMCVRFHAHINTGGRCTSPGSPPNSTCSSILATESACRQLSRLSIESRRALTSRVRISQNLDARRETWPDALDSYSTESSEGEATPHLARPECNRPIVNSQARCLRLLSEGGI